MCGKNKIAKRKIWSQYLCYCGKAIVVVGVVYLLVLAGLALTEGAGVNIFQAGKWVDNVAIALAIVSVGLGLLAWGLGWESDERMKAIARLEFREKIAMMYGYMRDEERRKEWDIKAADELRPWVSDDLRLKYDELKEKMNNTETPKIDEPQKSDSEIIREQLNRIEERLEKNRVRSWFYFVYGLGLAAMAAGMGLATREMPNGDCLLYGFVMFAIGFVLIIVDLIFMAGKGTKSKPSSITGKKE
jgi:hypothetical protein